MDTLTPPRPAAGHLRLMGGSDMGPVEQARTILVVEDDVLTRKLFVRCLEEGGYTVIEAEDPREVVELMLDSTPDMVVMDIGMSGVELIKQVRAASRPASIPVLAVTNLASLADKRRLANAGFDGHVSNPITPEDFLATVEAFLGAGATRMRG